MEFGGAKSGQILLPIVQLMESASHVVESVIHGIQIHTLETFLTLSAEQIAGQRTPGKRSGEIRWHGSQPGKIKLADREVKVKRPRLRHKSEGEVKIPAYEKLRQDRGLQQHMLGALMRGVSTRAYDEVLPEMAETAKGRQSDVFSQIGIRQQTPRITFDSAAEMRDTFGMQQGGSQYRRLVGGWVA